MQLQGFLLMIFTFVILPVFVLFSNHNIFFIVMSLILLISTLRSIYIAIVGYKKGIPPLSEEDQDILDEIESSIDFDFKRFDTGIRVARYAISILFYLYCSFYVSNIILRVLVAAVIVYWIYYIINTIKINDAFRMAFSRKKYQRILSAIANSAAAIVILIVAYNKLR
jgi:small-conductance mechanosensitive channel